jgi:hypothetical protein
VAMSVLGRLGGAHGPDRSVGAIAAAAAKLLPAYCDAGRGPAPAEKRRLQFVRVEHVHVNEGEQAVIGMSGARQTRHIPPLAIRRREPLEYQFES